MMWSVARAKSEELFVAACLLVVIGAGLVSAIAGVSMALGAFVAGLLLAETEFRHEVQTRVEPFKGLLLGLFFIAVGMGIDLDRVVAEPWLIAGGVGLLLVQWLKLAGATVIAVAGTQRKLALAAAHGADHGVLDGSDVAAQVRALTGGRGVDVVFDGVGKNSWESSLDSLKRRGLMISFGNASGPVSGVDLGILARKGSLFATRPTLFDYYATPEERLQYAGRVLGLMASGGLKLAINQRYKLANAAKAHEDLAARLTTGSTVLVP